MAIAVPGWPEFACWTASIARVRIVLIESWSWFTLSSHQQPHLPIERLLGGDIHLVARLRRLQNRPRELGMVTKHAVEVALVEHATVDDLEPLAAVALDQVEGGLRSPRSRGVVREVLGGAGRPDVQDGLGDLPGRLHQIRP